MESSPNSNHPPVNPKDAEVIADIDRTLEEYDAMVERRRIDHMLAIGLVATQKEVEP